jgi:hypothetical protein
MPNNMEPMALDTEELKRLANDETIRKRVMKQREEALAILDNFKTLNKPDSISLRGDGVFISGHRNIVSPYEVLQQYHRLATAVQQAHLLLNCSMQD